MIFASKTSNKDKTEQEYAKKAFYWVVRVTALLLPSDDVMTLSQSHLGLVPKLN